jgi:manganese transport protein
MAYEQSAIPNMQSLPEVHSTVSTAHAGLWRKLLAFAGPAYLVSVGYMDPGNWATDLEGGARFGYQLLWVLIMSNAMALLLQTLSARLGIVTRRDLAQACRDEYPIAISYALWILCELAIVACDLAEVLGAAIGLNLLFKIPLLAGVVLTAADTLLILWFTRYGIRFIEAAVVVLIATIGACFAFEIFLAHPVWTDVAAGVIPRLNSESLYIAVAILGATVMPHNLYLHSALVQTRRIGETKEDKRTACKFNFFDSMFALNGALFVNAAILILAAAVFFKHGIVVREIQQAHELLTPLLGTTLASVLFGAALICSGQSSTLTGTMAGQIVMEGFIRFRVQPWLRRLSTRILAITPAVLTIWYAGDQGTYKLLIFSQVILSLQLPFAVIPLVRLTGDKARMGDFANGWIVSSLAWIAASIILILNIFLASNTLSGVVASSGEFRNISIFVIVVLGFLLTALLMTILLWPWLGKARRLPTRVALPAEIQTSLGISPRQYGTILVSLDHSKADTEALSNAMALAKANSARVVLLHVEESVTSRLYGSLASTAEVKEGQDYFEEIAASLRQQGVSTEIVVRYGRSPAHEIAQVSKQLEPDLLIMAAHGHRGLKDLIFGSTINNVRHHVNVPILVVRSETG